MAEVAPDPRLVALLHESAVQGDDFARPVLYTWTTAAQASALRDSKRLLTRIQTEDGGWSVFDQRLKASSHRASVLLSTRPQLMLRRFAWPHAWATALGADAESYGDTLVRVVLKRDAIVGRFDPGRDEPWAFRDLGGREISLAEVLAHPQRLAAIYHVAADGPGGAPFREYVLVNESALEKFELFTPEIKAELERGKELARLLHEAELGVSSARDLAAAAPDVWNAASTDEAPAARWLAAVCFANPRYVPGAALADRLALALRGARWENHALVQKPTVRYADQKPPPPVKRPPRKCWGTLC